MADRRRVVLDAAISVLGNRGLRQLTHRTVDAEAGLPMGATSNVFRTREALVEGVLGRLQEMEREAWQGLAGAPKPTSAEEFTGLIAAMARGLATGPGRVMTLARHAIFLEAAHSPPLQQRIAADRRLLEEWGVPWIAGLGSTDPAGDLWALLSTLDGLLSNQLAAPDPDWAPERQIGVVVRGMLS
ncbi:TetR family transcriptional regulator [Phytomonospora sp. NPDC050363]|uniref:TetR/AcrR family transcriptional regulator n=1 Tax=Phytomonospora sp. NPDC050363 TaxID=3155642 RepID=UPI0034078CA1